MTEERTGRTAVESFNSLYATRQMLYCAVHWMTEARWLHYLSLLDVPI